MVSFVDSRLSWLDFSQTPTAVEELKDCFLFMAVTVDSQEALSSLLLCHGPLVGMTTKLLSYVLETLVDCLVDV